MSWILTGPERLALENMLRAHEDGLDLLGLVQIAGLGQSLDETAAALIRPVKLGYVEQWGSRGAVYQLTYEGRRLAAEISRCR